MEHESITYLPETIREQRFDAARELGKAGIFLASVNELYLAEQCSGYVSEDTKKMAEEAGMQYNRAIQGVLNANKEVRRFDRGEEST